MDMHFVAFHMPFWMAVIAQYVYSYIAFNLP